LLGLPQLRDFDPWFGPTISIAIALSLILSAIGFQSAQWMRQSQPLLSLIISSKTKTK
jgi:hypothetical protein